MGACHNKGSATYITKGRDTTAPRNPGLIRKDWDKLKEMSERGEMPKTFIGNADMRAKAMIAVDRLYPDIDINEYRTGIVTDKYYKEVGYNIQARDNTTSGIRFPKGYEDNEEVRRGSLKFLKYSIRDRNKKKNG